MSGGSKRREQARIHKPIGVHLRTALDKRWRVARLKDFGWDGACLLSKDPLKDNEGLELRMIASGQVGEHILQATVVWTRPPKPGSDLNEYGVRFDQTNLSVQSVITEAIRQVLSRSDESEKPDDKGPVSERRKARRAPLTTCVVSVRFPNEAISNWVQVALTNLSIEGMHFCSEQSILPGSPIEIKLEAQFMEPILLKAKVVWAEPAGRGTMGYGIHVSSGNSEQQLLYETFVQFSS